MPQFTYTDEEWSEAAGHRPLSELELPQLMLLHRHWIWANRQCVLFDREIRDGRPPRPESLAEDSVSAMFLWYALLWSVIEGFNDRKIELRERFREDVESIAEQLRHCRNAVFHVSRDKYYDKRLFDYMEDPDSAPKIRRIHSGFDRLFLEEFGAREIKGEDE